jgi:hypothetical protein
MYQNQQLMSTTPELKMVTLCKKHKILLQKDKNTNTFYLAFESKNKHINIPSIINFTMYELIGKLNEDVLEDIRIEKRHSDHDVEVLFLFKQFGQEVGIQKKYMYIRTIMERTKDQIVFKSQSIPYDVTKLQRLGNYEMVTSKCANLYVTIKNEHCVQIQYVYNIDIRDELPIYMENILGFLMKKVFYRLKKFIEKLEA